MEVRALSIFEVRNNRQINPLLGLCGIQEEIPSAIPLTDATDPSSAHCCFPSEIIGIRKTFGQPLGVVARYKAEDTGLTTFNIVELDSKGLGMCLARLPYRLDSEKPGQECDGRAVGARLTDALLSVAGRFCLKGIIYTPKKSLRVSNPLVTIDDLIENYGFKQQGDSTPTYILEAADFPEQLATF
ncbi:MAG TPA: hypothetical protein VJC17_04045 [Candidatus Dojkabacteria bacterium]|nr:hypothetical protein [Candidatus Dojkabacteria bacterium]